MSKVIVVNKYHLSPAEQKAAIYIGRGSPFGNPFKVNEHGRGKCIKLFAELLSEELKEGDTPLVRNLINLTDYVRKSPEPVKLMCFCSPRACHGDVIKQFIEANL